MSLSIGIVGLPNVGKSTLFNALTEKGVPAENYPFCTVDPSVGIVAVPDERLMRLSAFSDSIKTIPPVVEFVDIAGLVKGAHRGEGLGNQFLARIREADVIAHVVRGFEDADITHVHGTVRPYDDIEVINLELVMADLQTVTKRLSNIEKEVGRGEKGAVAEKSVLEKLLHGLQAGKSLRYIATDRLSPEEQRIVKQLHLLTTKPILYVLNVKSGSVPLERHAREELFAFLESSHSVWVEIDAGVEAELSGVDPDEKQQFRKELGVLEDNLDALIRKGYELLELITFFTTGEKETRGWQIQRSSKAPEAGAAIHSDFRDKFIRAEIISWDKLLAAGSHARARKLGLIRTEGREYVVKDGDVIEFKI